MTLQNILHYIVIATGLTIAVILVVFFDDISIGWEGRLLTQVSVGLLLGIVGVAFLHVGTATDAQERLLWLAIGGGFLFLAFDEQFLIHENIDFWIHDAFGAEETPFTDRLDGIIVLGYLLVALWFVRKFWPVLKKSPAIRSPLIAAFLFLIATVVLDLLHTSFFWDNAYFEESAKVLSEYCFLLAFVRGL